MKKFIKIATLSLCLLFISTSITACSLFSSSNNPGDSTPKTQDITVYKDDTPTTYTLTLGEVAEIDVFTKSGYYFNGAYDSAVGGTKYFGLDGKSLLAWEKTFPTTFYAQWKNIADLQSTFNVFGNEPQSGGTSGQRTKTITLDDDFVSAIKGNFDKKLKIEYTIDLKTSSAFDIDTAHPIRMYVKGYNNSGAEQHVIFTHTPLLDSFSTFTGSVEIPANDFASGNIYIVVRNTQKFMMSWAYPVFYSRNLTLNVSFA